LQKSFEKYPEEQMKLIKKATLSLCVGWLLFSLILLILSGKNLFRSPNFKFFLHHINMEEPIKHDNNNSEGDIQHDIHHIRLGFADYTVF